jgi:hypothetical protein
LSGRLRGQGDSLLGLGLELGIQGDALGDIFRIDDPAGHRERNGPREQVGILADRDINRDQPISLVSRFDRAKPLPSVIQRLFSDGVEGNDPGRHFVQPALAIELRGGQIAGIGRAASPNPNQLA